MRRLLLLPLLASAFLAPACKPNEPLYYCETLPEGQCYPPTDLSEGCDGSDVSKQTPYERMMNCATCSPDYAFTLAGVAVCNVPEQPVDDPAQPTPTPATAPTLDLSRFADHMRLLDGQTVGYAWGLVDTRAGSPRLAVSGASGDATPDGTKMSPRTLANVGSTTKVLGGVSLIHAFEELGPSRNPQAITLDRFLATPFLYFLPQNAKLRARPSLATVTIGELLRHRSGLRISTSTDPDNDLKNLLAENPTPVEKVQWSYNNMGFVVARYLITFLNEPSKREAIEAKWDLSLDELSAEIDAVTRGYYRDYVDTEMKTAIGSEFRSTCEADTIPGAASMFDDVTNRNAFVYGAGQWGGCSTQGGNWTSVDDWAKFFVAYENGKLVSPQARHLMSNRDAVFANPGDNRMIWSRYGGAGFSPWLEGTHGVGDLFWHGGDHSKDANGLTYDAHAAVIQLLWGYYGVAIVNSKELGSNALATQLRVAFAKATGAP